MDYFQYIQIVSRIEHYEDIARKMAEERREAQKRCKHRPAGQLTPGGEQIILMPVQKHA